VDLGSVLFADSISYELVPLNGPWAWTFAWSIFAGFIVRVVRYVPARIVADPSNFTVPISSPRNSDAQIIPKSGAKKVTVTALDGPMSAISRKNKT
jgi:hypothetical protein